MRSDRNLGSKARCCLLLAAAILAGCDGPQSALDPAGHDAERIADLFWVMCIASVVIWAGVMAVAFYAARRRDAPPRAANLLILGGGLVLSISVLTVLLIYGLILMASLRAAGTG